MQALMLAAGMGKRLGKFTNDNTKCMVEVAGEKLIDRAIDAINLAGIKRFILVIGYKGENLKQYILSKYVDSSIEFIFIKNKDYATSNNIYSFYLAKDYMQEDDTILLESDLIYDKTLIKKLIDFPENDVVTVAKYESWMDGTVVKCDNDNNVTQFIDKVDMDLMLTSSYYKTVNIYKFSKKFFKHYYLPFLEAYMKTCGLNSYYETVLKVMSNISHTSLKAMHMEDLPWYEIDDAQDLDIAGVLFKHGEAKYDDIISKFGGYWRYNKTLDFCYLVNPYFPPQKMVEKMQNEFSVLLTQYPSGLKIQNMNAERIFDVNQFNMLVGNGAAELINVLGLYVKGKVAVALPTFNEYVRCFRNCEMIKIDNSAWDYAQNIKHLKALTKTMDYIIVVNPDNPSGYLLTQDEIYELLDAAKENNCRVVIDESFVDFAKSDKRFTLLSNEILETYDNLIVIKSISKSYGVPALRLGILASSNQKILCGLRSLLPVWNINSFAEYYLQLYNQYSKYYIKACDKIADERSRMIEQLNQLKRIKVYPSQANFIMLDLGKINSYDFCVRMLDNHNILIKDLSSKNYFENKNFIRVAIRDTKDNDAFLNAIQKEIVKE